MNYWEILLMLPALLHAAWRIAKEVGFKNFFYYMYVIVSGLMLLAGVGIFLRQFN